ncbi:MAG: hypothetical protein PHW02_00280 [bacterium]|nr:hypothetical protein [bacterium]
MKRIILLALVLTSFFCYSQNFDSLKILLIDFDEGKTFANPDNSQNIGYEYNFIKAFKALGFSEDSNLVVKEKIPESFDLIKDYAAIFFITGHRPYVGVDLTVANITNFESYLDSGGCLYIEGNNAPSGIYDKDSLFMFNYFNNSCTDNGGTGFSGIDTIVSDTTDTLDPFFRFYKFVYPANTKPDSSVDVIGPKNPNLLKVNYRNLLQYDDQTKLYKSTSSSYTPPETKTFYFPGKTVMQSVAFSAFADPQNAQDALDDSLENQLIRAAYLRDILKYFGIGKTLLVKDDGEVALSDKKIIESLDKLGVEFDEISVKTGGAGPNYKTLVKYANVIWYTGEESTLSLLAADTFALSRYLDFGGDLLLSGENLAQGIGVPDTNTLLNENRFLSMKMRVDYIGNPFKAPEGFNANVDGHFYANLGSRICSLETVTTSKPDMLRPFLIGHVDSAFYFYTLTKGNNIVGIANEGILRKTIFCGFSIENLYQRDLDSVLEVSFVDYFDMNLDFEPRKWDDATSYSKRDSGKMFVKTNENSPKVFCVQRTLFVEGLSKPELLDISGRNLTNLESGYNKLTSDIKSGVYFVRGEYRGSFYVKVITVF